jgi:hypothetical protein
MNEWKDIIKATIDSIVPISLVYKGEQISYGSGTVCNQNGKILTACHVIDQIGDLEKDLNNVRLEVKLKDYGVRLYKPLLIGITLSVPNLIDGILIDVAIIEPLEPVKTKEYLTPKLDFVPIEFGESMLLAGFSEETPFIFNLDEIIRNKIPLDNRSQFNLNLGFMKQPTFKSGILSHKAGLHVTGNMTMQSEVYHIDNGMHSGASGGPIINSQGEFVGIITHRAMIPIKILVEKNLMQMFAPSGNTFGIGTSALKCYENLI